jgi:hypothetical protein
MLIFGNRMAEEFHGSRRDLLEWDLGTWQVGINRRKK